MVFPEKVVKMCLPLGGSGGMWRRMVYEPSPSLETWCLQRLQGGLWRDLGPANKACFITVGANSCVISAYGSLTLHLMIKPPDNDYTSLCSHQVGKLAANSLADGVWQRPRSCGHGLNRAFILDLPSWEHS